MASTRPTRVEAGRHARRAAPHFLKPQPAKAAATVCAIGVVGRPALLVPYPYALDHDQAANAATLQAAGGAEVHVQSTLSTERLAALLGGLMRDPQRLSVMAAAARSAGRPDATRLLADLTEAIASGQSIAQFREGARA